MTNKKYKIAFGRIMFEVNSFSKVETTLEDFKRTHLMEGEELVEACKPKNWEVKGYLKNLELSGFMKAVKKHKDKNIEAIPLFSAWSISGGPLANQDFNYFYEKLKKQLTDLGEVDGVFLALHGALGVTGEIDPEAKILAMVREIVGKDTKIAVSFDLHGNMTYEKMESLDILCAYHSNPHWDMAATGYKSGNILIKTISNEVNLTTTWRTLPMIMGGGITISLLPPMKAIFDRMKELEQNKKVLSCSTFMVHPWLDHPDLGWSIQVTTDNDQELAEEIANELSKRCWAVRKKQLPDFPSATEAIKVARKSKMSRKMGVVTFCDASDSVGAGGTGENTNLLKALLEEAKDMISYTTVRDPKLVEEIWEKELNQEVEVSIGGKLQPDINPAIEMKAKVLAKKETSSFGKIVTLDLGHVKVVITEGMNLAIKPEFYSDAGIDPWNADIVIAKNFFHFRLYFLAISRKTLNVKTKGITDLDKILEVKTNDPVYPKDNVEDWREIDAKRRKVPEITLDNLDSATTFLNNKKSEYKINNRSLILNIVFFILIGLSFLLKRKK